MCYKNIVDKILTPAETTKTLIIPLLLFTSRINLMWPKFHIDALMMYPIRAEFVSGDKIDQIKSFEKFEISSFRSHYELTIKRVPVCRLIIVSKSECDQNVFLIE